MGTSVFNKLSCAQCIKTIIWLPTYCQSVFSVIVYMYYQSGCKPLCTPPTKWLLNKNKFGYKLKVTNIAEKYQFR